MKNTRVIFCNIGQNIQDNGIISLDDVVSPHPMNQLTTLPCSHDNRVSRGKGARKAIRQEQVQEYLDLGYLIGSVKHYRETKAYINVQTVHQN